MTSSTSRAVALKIAVAKLSEAGIETPARDAQALLMDAEKISAATLMANPDALLQRESAFQTAIARRLKREPVSKIKGYRDFWKYRFKVTKDVLDPRPETETLIEACLKIIPSLTAPKILDLGTGSGCMLLTLLLEIKNAEGVGIDVSRTALAVAKENALSLGLESKAEFIASDWFEALDDTFDVVVCNPPYISLTESNALSPEVKLWDPEGALFAGMDGLQAYRKIADGLAPVLRPNGAAFFEIGIGQANAVSQLFRDAGFRRVSSLKDLGGIERCIIVQH